MAEQCFPFSAGAGASITDAQFQAYLAGIIGDGVRAGFANTLGVSAGSGMQSSVATGAAYLTGLYYNNDAPKAVTHGAADPTNDRIDVVAVHVNLTASTDGAGVTARNGAVIILAGTPAGSPVAPGTTQNSNMWEIPLYQVRVPHGAASSASFTYTDVRSYARADIPAGTITDAMMQNQKVNRSGDTITGALTVNGAISADSGKIASDGSGNLQAGNYVLGSGANIYPMQSGGARNWALYGWNGSSVQQAIQINSDGSIQLHAGGAFSALSIFSGTGSGTFNHGLGTTPRVVLPMEHAAGSQTMGYDSENGTSVHITAGAGAAWVALALA